MVPSAKSLACWLFAPLLLKTGTAFISLKPHIRDASSHCQQALPFDTAFLTDPNILSIRNATCTIHKSPRRRRWRFWKSIDTSTTDYQFDYEYNEVELIKSNNTDATTAILLIHPIGVGIGRWFYNRLLQSLYNKRDQLKSKGRVVVVAPDLLACGSASNPSIINQRSSRQQKLPLFTVSDWSSQVEQLMTMNQHEQSEVVQWCIVFNGGCVPIALDLCQNASPHQPFDLNNVVLSAPPRLFKLLQDGPPMNKVHENYRILSRTVVGRLFWWFALRKNGKFIQTFSETNLAADPKNLGEEWTRTCVATATSFPNSRYSTFCFLAGALELSCRPAFDALATNKNKTDISVNVILGGDKRRNPAKSWFWETKGKQADTTTTSEQSLSHYLQSRQIRGGQETIVGGRRCPAHEDSNGFADALISYLNSND